MPRTEQEESHSTAQPNAAEAADLARKFQNICISLESLAAPESDGEDYVRMLKAEVATHDLLPRLRQIVTATPAEQSAGLGRDSVTWLLAASIAFGTKKQEKAWLSFAVEARHVELDDIPRYIKLGVREIGLLVRITLDAMAKLTLADEGDRQAFRDMEKLLGGLIVKNVNRRAALCLDVAKTEKNKPLRRCIALVLNRVSNYPSELKIRDKVDSFLNRQSNRLSIKTEFEQLFGLSESVLPISTNILSYTQEPDKLDVATSNEVHDLGEGTPQHQSEDREEERPAYLEALLLKPAKNATYEHQVANLETARRDFDRRYVAAFLRILKVEMQQEHRKHHTIDEKRSFVEWVNSEVKRMGLVFKNPKVDHQATLMVDKGNDERLGRFQLRTQAEQSGTGRDETFSTPSLAALLPKLQLTYPQARKEGWVVYKQKKQAPSEPKGGPSLA